MNAELMLLGFISLLITVGTKPISQICIPEKAGNTMLPCKKEAKKDYGNGDGRKLLWYAGDDISHRLLAAAASGDDYCSQKVNKRTHMHMPQMFNFFKNIEYQLINKMVIGRIPLKRPVN